MADLIRRPVAVIVGNTPSALAAKAATTTVPIVFTTGSDPVKLGLVASLNRPGGNVTGVSFLTGALGAKRLELLRLLVPKASTIAVLASGSTDEADRRRLRGDLRDVEVAAQAIGQQLIVVDVDSDADIETAFATFVQRGAGALLASTGAFLNSRRDYALCEYATVGGLMSYGTSVTDAYRQVGIYAGRILKGEKPADRRARRARGRSHRRPARQS